MEDDDVDSVAEDMRAAFDELSAKEAPAEPVAPTPAPAAEPQEGAQEPSDATAAPAPAPTPAPAAPAAPAERFPVSWRPALKEKWDGLDPEVRLEVLRRDREVDHVLQTSAQARKFADEFQRTIAPYEPILRASNASPMQAISSLMQTAAQLRTSSPEHKAQLVANLINEYGVDITALDRFLTNQTQNPQANLAPLMQALDQRLQPIQQFMGELQNRKAMAAQQNRQEAETQLQSFMTDPKNEFFDHVRVDMAELMELAAARGQQMSLQDAYNRAILLHPQIADVVQQRKLKEHLSQQDKAARAAKEAAASIPNSGAPLQSSEDETPGDDIRSALSASIRNLNARR